MRCWSATIRSTNFTSAASSSSWQRTGCRECSRRRKTWLSVDSWPTGRAFPICSGAPPATCTGSCKVPSRATCRWSRRRSLISPSTSRPPRRSASTSRRPCLPAPTSTELTADSEHLGHLCGSRRRPLRWTCRHDGDERRDHTRIERIALGQDPARPRELPQFERIDLAHGHAGGEQGARNTTLVAAARLDADPRDRAPTQALNQICPTGSVVAHRTALLLGQHDDVQTILRHVDSAKREHLRIPSLLMRARAQATVRVWKKRPELQAHSRFANPSACGLPVATGAER